MKRLLLFVEGEGDVEAGPVLVRKILHGTDFYQHLFIDDSPFRVGGLHKLRTCCEARIKAALKRSNTAAILILLDGDLETWDGKPFCPRLVASEITKLAIPLGAGTTFSIATVIARQEFESWLLAGTESLAGRDFSDGRLGVREGAVCPSADPENSPRNAKGALGELMHSSYKVTTDQRELMEFVDLDVIRRRELRSFRRVESAVKQLFEACRTGNHIATPA